MSPACQYVQFESSSVTIGYSLYIRLKSRVMLAKSAPVGSNDEFDSDVLSFPSISLFIAVIFINWS